MHCVLLQENYAKKDPAKVAAVKAIYKELEIEKAYRDYEEQSYKDLIALINKLGGDLSKEMFVSYANKIYKRIK